MKDKVSLRRLSDELGVGASTAYRALNGCGGVDPCTAEMIRARAKQQSYSLPSSERVDCALILPETPAYFWKAVAKDLSAQMSDLSVRLFLFSGMTDLCGAVYALETATKLSPAVIVAALPQDRKISALLEESGIPVFFCFERFALKNSFFFGSDASGDGAALADALSERYPSLCAPLVLRFDREPEIFNTRRTAFLSRFSPEKIRYLSVGDPHCPYAASVLARQLSADPGFDFIYCGTGILPTVCLAMEKCRLPKNIVCVGFEDAPGNRPYLNSGRLAAVADQDLAKVSEVCAAAVRKYLFSHTYPDRKSVQIPSRILFGEKT